MIATEMMTMTTMIDDDGDKADGQTYNYSFITSTTTDNN